MRQSHEHQLNTPRSSGSSSITKYAAYSFVGLAIASIALPEKNHEQDAPGRYNGPNSPATDAKLFPQPPGRAALLEADKLIADLKSAKLKLEEIRFAWRKILDDRASSKTEIECHLRKYGQFSAPVLRVEANAPIHFSPLNSNPTRPVLKDRVFADRLIQVARLSLELRADLTLGIQTGVIKDPEIFTRELSDAINSEPEWKAFAGMLQSASSPLQDSEKLASVVGNLALLEIRAFGESMLVGPQLVSAPRDLSSFLWIRDGQSVAVKDRADLIDVSLDIVSDIAPSIRRCHPTINFDTDSGADAFNSFTLAEHSYADDTIQVSSIYPTAQVLNICHELGHAICRTQELSDYSSITSFENLLSLIDKSVQAVNNEISLLEINGYSPKSISQAQSLLDMVKDNIALAESTGDYLSEAEKLRDDSEIIEEAAAFTLEEIAARRLIAANPEHTEAYSKLAPLSNDGLLTSAVHWKGRWIARQILISHRDDLRSSFQFLTNPQRVEDIRAFKELLIQADFAYRGHAPLARPDAKNLEEERDLLMEEWRKIATLRTSELKAEWTANSDKPDFQERVKSRMEQTRSKLVEIVRGGISLK